MEYIIVLVTSKFICNNLFTAICVTVLIVDVTIIGYVCITVLIVDITMIHAMVHV